MPYVILLVFFTFKQFLCNSYTADSHLEVKGVMRAFWNKYLVGTNIYSLLAREKTYPDRPLFFNFASSFLYIKAFVHHVREMRAYFLVCVVSIKKIYAYFQKFVFHVNFMIKNILSGFE
jgi:hypothetical protein